MRPFSVAQAKRSSLLLLFGVNRIEMSHQHQPSRALSRTTQKLVISKAWIDRRNPFLQKTEIPKLRRDDLRIAKHARAITREAIDRDQPLKEVERFRERRQLSTQQNLRHHECL